tara:strand:+ start:2131 stop:3261 length:1131 start_codon:yes stop_codon:yes gene_type:complete
MIMLAFGACFQLIVFAGYNGLTDSLKDALSLFDPQLQVIQHDNKFFPVDTILINKIKSLDGIDLVTKVIEGDAGISYKDVQVVTHFKGVDESYRYQNNIDTAIIQGHYQLIGHNQDHAVLGMGLKSRLHVQLNGSNPYKAISLFYPNRNKKIGASSKSFNRMTLYPSGVFAVEPRFDNSLLVSYEMAQLLTNHEGDCSSLEIKLLANTSTSNIQEQIQTLLGTNFKVLTREQQRASLFKALKTEEFVVALILIFLLALCSLSVYLTVLMIVIAKQKDLAVLKSLGATNQQIRNIILKEAFYLSIRGLVIGVSLGTLLVQAQLHFNLMKIDNYGTAFPVTFLWSDLIFAIFSTVTIAFFMATPPAIRASKIKVQDLL